MTAAPSIIRAQSANALSASRLALAALWLVAFAGGRREPAILGAIAVLGAGSDLLDGRLARRLSIASGIGRWVDSVADIVFVMTALVSEAWVGALPAYIPALIALSFSQYAIDSVVLGRGGGSPVRSRLGHWGGVINYALVMVLAIAPAPRWPGRIAIALCPLLAIFYLAAIGERIAGYVRR
jgi:phosphatidylglycerophosphate synthase